MVVYIDSAYKCHVKPVSGAFAVETDLFNGKCEEYICGYRYVPEGHTFVDEKGVTRRGAVMYPIENLGVLERIQKAVDKNDNERDAEIAALIEEIYNEDLEVIG